MIKDLITQKHVWRIDNFSKLGSECCENIFPAGDRLWSYSITIYSSVKHCFNSNYQLTAVLKLWVLQENATLSQGTKTWSREPYLPVPSIG